MTAAATPPAPRDLRQELAQAQQALAAAQAASDRAAYLSALERQAQALLDSGDAKAAVSPYSLLLKFYRGAPAGAAPDARRTAQALTGLALCDLLRGNLDPASANLKQALELARSAGDPVLEARLLAHQGRILIEGEQFQLAAGVLQQSLTAARQARDALAAAQALLGQAHLAQETNAPAQVRPLAQQALQAAQAARDPGCQIEALCQIAEASLRQQDAGQAARLAEGAVQLARQTGCRGGEMYALLSLGAALLEQGELRPATRTAEAALALARSLENRSGEYRALLLFSAVHHADLDLPGARQACGLALELARSLGQTRRAARAEARLSRLLAQTDRPGRSAGSRSLTPPPMQVSFDESVEPGGPEPRSSRSAGAAGSHPLAPPPAETPVPSDESARMEDSRLPSPSVPVEPASTGAPISMTGQIDDLVVQGLEHFQAGRIPQALALYTQALEAYRQAGEDLPAQVDTLFLMGNAHRQAGALEQAIQCYNRSLSIARQANYPGGEAEALGALGQTCIMQAAAAEPQNVLSLRRQAVELLEQAIQANHRAPDHVQAGRLWTGLAAAQNELGLYPQALESLQNVLDEFRAAADPGLVRAALLNFGEQCDRLEEFSQAADAYESALGIEQPPQGDDEYTLAVMGFALACEALEPGDLDQAIDTLAEALQIARQADLAEIEVRAMSHLGRLLSKRCKLRDTTDDLVHASDLVEKAMQRAADVGNPETAGLAAYNRGLSCLDLGRPEDARCYFDEAMVTYRQAGIRSGEAKVHIALGEMDVADKRYGEALAHFDQAAAIYRETGCRRLEVFPLARSGELRFALKDWRGARQAQEQVIHRAGEFGLADVLGSAWLCLGKLDLAEENPAQAIQSLRSALDALQTVGSPKVETAQKLLDEAEKKSQAKKSGGLFRKK